MRLDFQYTDNTKGTFKVSHVKIDTDLEVYQIWEDDKQDLGYLLKSKSELERLTAQLVKEKYVKGRKK